MITSKPMNALKTIGTLFFYHRYYRSDFFLFAYTLQKKNRNIKTFSNWIKQVFQASATIIFLASQEKIKINHAYSRVKHNKHNIIDSIELLLFKQ